LRDQGLDVEDPAPGQGLQLDLEGDPSEANAALEACKDLAPPQPPGEEDPDAVADMLAYAQCMRDNGVEAFEDPEPGEGLSVGPGVADDPDFPAAEKVCSEQLPGKRPETHRSGS
jgi:hypothetical protein